MKHQMGVLELLDFWRQQERSDTMFYATAAHDLARAVHNDDHNAEYQERCIWCIEERLENA